MLPFEKSLLDHLPGNIGWKDLKFRYQGANKPLLTEKGLQQAEDIVFKTDEELSPESVADNQIFYLQDLRVLRGEKISVIHQDSKTNRVYLLEKNPIISENNRISGLIYYCRSWQKADVFHLLQQLDKKLNLGIQNYSLDYHQNIFQLTTRECECVFLLIRGKTAKEIAGLLSLSSRTVESYLENIKHKMDCRNKAEILMKALLNGYQEQIPSRLNNSAFMKSLG